MTGRRLAVPLVVAAALLGAASPASAGLGATSSASAEATARITEVAVTDGRLDVVVQTDGLPPGVVVDPATVELTVDGEPVTATAQLLSNGGPVTRTAVLAVDNSRSMAGDRLVAAKRAAAAFLAGLPADVLVGLVTFADEAQVALAPTTDRERVLAAVEALGLNDVVGTALYDGAVLAGDLTGSDGTRNVLLLTDGNEDGSSRASLADGVAAAAADDVALDAVYIGPRVQPPAQLQDLVGGAGGQVLRSGAADLAEVFGQAAAAISSQLLVQATLPAGAGGDGDVVVRAEAAGTVLSDSAFATLRPDSRPPAPSVDRGPRALPGPDRRALLGERLFPLALATLFLGLLVMAGSTLAGVRRDEKRGRVRRRLSFYTLAGRGQPAQPDPSTALGGSQVARSAVELAGRVVKRRGFDENLAVKLEAAGVPLRAAEWMLIHVGVAIGAALMATLVSGGGVTATVLGLALGLGLPFGYLTVKEGRRTAAFLSQLPETLQLLAGSLSAGHSMPQALEAVAREGEQPVTTEFNRALVEARLGVPMEDALEAVAERMQSKDFAWVVMAIRIQREVGGNLAELLTTVSATLRERERLRRQVKVLSAEGRLSAWILGLLPPVFALYLAAVQPEYLRPLVTEALGLLLVGMAVLMLAVGAVWLRRAVKVEV